MKMIKRLVLMVVVRTFATSVMATTLITKRS